MRQYKKIEQSHYGIGQKDFVCYGINGLITLEQSSL